MPFSRPFTPPALSSSLITNHHNNNNNGGHGTPPDHDMMEPSPRPSLPSSLADFALPHSAPSSPSMSLMALDEPHPFTHIMAASPSPIGHPLLRKIRRPSLLGLGLPKGTLDTNILASGYGSRMNSPLISSFTSPFAFDCPPNGGRSGNGGGTPGGNSGNGTANQGGRSTNSTQDEEEEFAPELMFDTAEPSPHIRESSTEPTQIEEPASPSPTRIKRKSRSPTPTGSSSVTLITPSLQPPIDINYKNSRRVLGNSNSNSTTGNNNNGNGNLNNPSRLLLPPKSPTSAASSGRPAIPRLLTIMSESNTQESEVKSEASFQRLIASHAELPPRRGLFHPRTPRSRQNSASGGIGGRRMMYYRSDRGRFPEEALDEDELLADDDQGSSDDGDDEESAVGVSAPGGKAVMSFNDDSVASLMSLGGSGGSGNGSGSMLDSPAGMDVDFVSGGWQSHAQMFGSPPVNGGAVMMSGHSTPSHSAQWRHTPPPTATTARGSKRKFDDRYEPYPTAKRRAVSPAISLSGNTMMGASPIAIPRSPITMSRSLPLSATSSPILRPVVRLSSSRGGSSNMIGLSDGSVMMIGSWNASNGKNEEREVQGAGDGVGSLTL